jgi:hypothetical protein
MLVDVDPNSERLDLAKKLLFCGMTRATVRLDLLVNVKNDYNRHFSEI